VLLVRLIREGEAFLAKLDGIFAFAFVDLETLGDAGQRRLRREAAPIARRRLYVSSPPPGVSESSLRLSNVARYLSCGIVGNGEAIVAGVSGSRPTRSNIPVRQCGSHRQDSRFRLRYERRGPQRSPYDVRGDRQPPNPYGVCSAAGSTPLVLDRCAGDCNLFGAYSVDVGHPQMSSDGGRAGDRRARHATGTASSKQGGFLHQACKDFRRARLPFVPSNFVGSYLLTRRAQGESPALGRGRTASWDTAGSSISRSRILGVHFQDLQSGWEIRRRRR
jgi:hypothetical protein